MNEPTTCRDHVLARGKQVTDVCEATWRVGLDLAHVENHVGVSIDQPVAVIGRRDPYIR